MEEHPEGTILPVRARPRARSNQLRSGADGVLKVCVTQVAEKGKANAAIQRLLAQTLGLRKSQLELVAGASSTAKRFLVRGLSPPELGERIEHALAQGDS
ncbi:MAG TPA: DUF167 domain-containing protein [Planctomycetaceae bacterium]|nr:DUF167 domain-containing protein [Planctomycetaceae bacterium]HIQ19993.1 DUF167 domain-containing protein [Planctomycetota bacterium]